METILTPNSPSFFFYFSPFLKVPPTFLFFSFLINIYCNGRHYDFDQNQIGHVLLINDQIDSSVTSFMIEYNI